MSRKSVLGKMLSVAVVIFCMNSSIIAQEENIPETIQKTTVDKAIEFSLKSIEGEQVILKSYRNKKVVMIVFWATWCGYCVEEIPDLIKLHDAVDKTEFEILAINVQEKREDVSAYAKKRGIKYKILLDPDGKVTEAYKVTGIPANIVVDKKGNIVYDEHTMPPDTIKYIEKLTGKKANPETKTKTKTKPKTKGTK